MLYIHVKDCPLIFLEWQKFTFFFICHNHILWYITCVKIRTCPCRPLTNCKYRLCKKEFSYVGPLPTYMSLLIPCQAVVNLWVYSHRPTSLAQHMQLLLLTSNDFIAMVPLCHHLISHVLQPFLQTPRINLQLNLSNNWCPFCMLSFN